MKIFTRTDASVSKQTLRIFREEMRSEPGEKRSFITGMILVPLSYLFYIVLLPLLISFTIQSMVDGSIDQTMPWYIGGMVLVSVAAIIANQIGYGQIFVHQERMATKLLNRAIRSLMTHSQGFFANQKVGSLSNDVNNFSRSYLTLLDTVTMQLMSIVVSYLASLIVIAIVAPIVLLPMIALTGFIVWHSLRSMSVRSKYRNRRKELQSQLLGQVADVLGNQSLVRLFGRSNDEISSVDNNRKAIVDVATKEIDLIQQNAKIRQIVLFSAQTLIIILIVWLFQNDLLSLGAGIFIITYLVRITSTMFNITGIIRGIEQSFLDAAKITELLQLQPEIKDSEQADILNVKTGKIQFADMSFAYADAPDDTVFKSLSLTIEPGQKVGLVGRSGGGKTTLTSLLLRYADVTGGAIKIDDTDIRLVTQDSLRSNISYVPQDPYLFHRSLRENIAYGKPEATDDEIKTAAAKAYAMEFIEQLPAGLDTVVGERGIKLSGGQRQRIAIARAILKDAPILVLDEATSALDSESEIYIQKALTELMKNRTSIVVAHRLSTIANLDRIIVLDNGQIVEDGPHDKLVAEKGMYANLWSHQSGGFIEE